MDSILYCRIKYLCDLNNISLNKLEDHAGLGNGAISKWKSSNSPSIDKVIKVAQFFNVSTDYLLGFSDVATPINELIEDKNIITLQRARVRMTPKDRERMMQMIRLGFDYAFENPDDTGE